MNLNHILERGVRDYLRKEYPDGLPRRAFGMKDRGTIVSSFEDGFDEDNKKYLPFTLVRSGEAEEFIPNSGNYKIDLAVSFVSHIGDTKADQHVLWANDLMICLQKLEWVDYLSENRLVRIYTPFETTAQAIDIEDNKRFTTIGFHFVSLQI